ncbi:MAG TPA: CvpA family protein [Candidatus Omnitrophota bacterium]|nr:CvpA family protein [Candidatus Omnitrophota bacterium]
MLLNTLKQFNWLDILILIVISRVCYIALKNGFTAEFFKIFGTLMAVYISMHYCVLLADYAIRVASFDAKASLEIIYFIFFVALASSGYLLFFLLRKAFDNFVKIETVSALNKWGGLILGALRSILLVSLIAFAMVVSSVPYFKNSVKNSYLGQRLVLAAPDTYTWAWENIFSKFMTSEKEGSIVINTKKELI